jgi:hypothetical protein
LCLSLLEKQFEIRFCFFSLSGRSNVIENWLVSHPVVLFDGYQWITFFLLSPECIFWRVSLVTDLSNYKWFWLMSVIYTTSNSRKKMSIIPASYFIPTLYLEWICQPYWTLFTQCCKVTLERVFIWNQHISCTLSEFKAFYQTASYSVTYLTLFLHTDYYDCFISNYLATLYCT